jgi:cathepsin F
VAIKNQFLDFQRTYNKVYATAEEFQFRYNVFAANLERAAAFQKKEKSYGATFGVTKFMDLTPEEFSTFYKMPNVNFTRDYVAPPKKDFTQAAQPWPGAPTPDPTNFDWATTPCVSPVYNQQQCGSCWAFSATETIESYSCLGSNMQMNYLAVQQIVDCDTSGQDQGCNGGFPSGAYSYIQSAGGQEYCDAYPYTGQTGSCQYNQADDVSQLTNSQSISGEDGMYTQLSSASGGPLSVCVDASSWQYYQGGVLTSCTNNVDHCVQATGYANYGQSGAYWIVRNSWATTWGINGYIWIEIGQDLCSIGDYVTVVSGDFTTTPSGDACSSQINND